VLGFCSRLSSHFNRVVADGWRRLVQSAMAVGGVSAVRIHGSAVVVEGIMVVYIDGRR
jgi:uncharacterized protein YjeT (DUF2065 family)